MTPFTNECTDMTIRIKYVVRSNIICRSIDGNTPIPPIVNVEAGVLPILKRTNFGPPVVGDEDPNIIWKLKEQLLTLSSHYTSTPTEEKRWRSSWLAIRHTNEALFHLSYFFAGGAYNYRYFTQLC